MAIYAHLFVWMLLRKDGYRFMWQSQNTLCWWWQKMKWDRETTVMVQWPLTLKSRLGSATLACHEISSQTCQPTPWPLRLWISRLPSSNRINLSLAKWIHTLGNSQSERNCDSASPSSYGFALTSHCGGQNKNCIECNPHFWKPFVLRLVYICIQSHADVTQWLNLVVV